MFNLVYLYLYAPLHTGGTSQEGNLVGIARESHTNLPYVPSSTIRGRLRAATDDSKRIDLWGNTIDDIKNSAQTGVSDASAETSTQTSSSEQTNGSKQSATNLIQGKLWVGDASIFWMPVPSLSHGVVWVSCPLLLQRWLRFSNVEATLPEPYQTSLGSSKPIYLKDAILPAGSPLKDWNSQEWQKFFPAEKNGDRPAGVLVLPNQHCATLIEMSLWRQVKIKLDENKTVDGGFRYEEAIPPDTLMYFPWGTTTQANGKSEGACEEFRAILAKPETQILQIGGQESLGRGFVKQWMAENNTKELVSGGKAS